MPVYHSAFNDYKGQGFCGAVVLPLKTKVKGPAPPAKTTDRDIIDEAIDYFRANVLYRNFQIQGPADLVLCYLTAFIAEVLRQFAKYKDKNEARQKIVTLKVSQNFLIPGDNKWEMQGFFKNPGGKQEEDVARQYFRQLREELCDRLLEVAYGADGKPNKWWMQFSKRKFMNIATMS